MIVNVPLDRIHDNPFQPRREYPGIEELAEKIRAMKGELPATRGLIHVPNARVVNSAGVLLAWLGGFSSYSPDYAVQLAEGHRRLRAFRLLAPSDPDYATMPVDIGDLDDRAMDDIAWDENTARQDLSPVEEARALQRTLERFGLTQADLAGRRRLARSTVSNKLRLLQLPDALLQAIHERRLTERHGVSYLPILDIPAADLKLANLTRKTNFGSSWEKPTPDALAKRMIEIGDLTADQVRDVVERVQKEVEAAKKRAWDEQQRAARPAPVMTPISSAPAAPIPIQMPGRTAPEAGPVPGMSGDSGEAGAEAAPLAAGQPEMKPLAPPALPDVVITIRVKRSDGNAFTLSAGEAGQWPQMFSGVRDELVPTLEHALDLFIPKEPPVLDGEQTLMEMEVSSDD